MPQRLHVCLVDMNNGVANQAIRCFKGIIETFRNRVAETNPAIDVVLTHVQPRNLNELPPERFDLMLSSGGPGSPFDGYEDPWSTGYRKVLDRIAHANAKDDPEAPKALLVCHSFELGILHFGVGQMQKRSSLKFGLMPAYTTKRGQDVDFL